MQIIKNFLPEEEFNNLKDLIINDRLPLYFENSVASEEDTEHFYFTHIFYDDQLPRSEEFKIILPILKKINLKALLRAKVNCYTKSEKLIKHGKHSDYKFSHNGAVFSLNTCDGGTFIGDNFIPSIENQMLFFDSGIPHQSTNCTDAKCRFNININYF